MRKTVYKCDQCNTEFGDKKHISLSFSSYSGIAIPPSTDEMVKFTKGFGNVWTVKESLNGKFMHFCNGQCISRFFGALMKKSI